MSLTSPPQPADLNEQHSDAEHSLNTRICRYFSRTGSCRAGSECPFLHDNSRLPQIAMTKPIQSESSGSSLIITEDGMVQDRRQAVTKPVAASRVVPKPVSQAQLQDPRQFQLGQIRRRFSPKETSQKSGTQLRFNLTPSDPDFPFEMAYLECLLSIPTSYPQGRPTLKVGNKDIPRGFALNVEHGFDSLAEDNPNATLLELMKLLDKNLESFLSAPKAETIKLVPNKDTRHLSFPSRSVEPPAVSKIAPKPETTSSTNTISTPQKAVQVFTSQQKAEASKRREVEIRQLEARMGRLSLYKKSGDGIAYTLPIEPRRRAELPTGLQVVKTFQLFVPLLYPLQVCRVQLDGVDSNESRPVEIGFEKKATEQKELTLMGLINYLAQNIHVLAKTTVELKSIVPIQQVLSQDTSPVSKSQEKQVEGLQDPDRSHIQYITRPPEWTVVDAEDAEDTEDFDSDVYSYDTDEETSEDDGGVIVQPENKEQPQPKQNQEKGTAISFPFIELYGIELLEVITLNITVRCERCKDTTEIKGLKNGLTKSESCRKCASPLSIGFRRDLVHAHAVRAGFLDLEGCVVGDMLPSTFIPTCSQCSTVYPAPGIVSVQGETTSNVCRECHQKFTFKIPQVKFLRISSAARLPSSAGPRRKKETLGLQPGTELPKRGRCRHYSKSYRWFRFSCCQKVYACDKCHDESEEHPNEWANRMICGWCSREQNYRPEDCSFCHGTMVGKRGGGGFWEGGKGTRDKVKMSRKDKRKFRRPAGSSKPKS